MTEPALVAYVSIVVARQSDNATAVVGKQAEPVAVAASGLPALQCALRRFVLSATQAVVDPGPGHIAIAAKRP